MTALTKNVSIHGDTASSSDNSCARGWIERVQPVYTWIMIGATGGLSALAIVAETPSILAQSIVLLILVGLIGLPHGAFDLHVGRSMLKTRLGGAWAPVFVSAYLAVCALALAFWILTPWMGLAILLLLGAAHWGMDDLEYEGARPGMLAWLSTSRGLIPVAMPLLAHPAEVSRIFAVITASDVASESVIRWTGAISMLLAAPGLFAHGALLLRGSRETFLRSASEVIVLVIWFTVTPPLLAFTVYFCLWHSVRHSLRSASRLDASRARRALRRYLRAVMLPTIATWMLAAAAWLILLRDYEFTSLSWQIVFVGLFALTVPHVILEAVAHRVHRLWPRSSPES